MREREEIGKNYKEELEDRIRYDLLEDDEKGKEERRNVENPGEVDAKVNIKGQK